MNNSRKFQNEENQSSFDNKVKAPQILKQQVCMLERYMFVENEKLQGLIAYQHNNSIIDLSCQNLTDYDMGIIIQHAVVGKKCQGLNLWGNQFTHESISILADILEKNKALKELDLSYNHISDTGVKIISELLSSNTCELQDIDLSHNGITDKGTIYLANMLKKNQTLKALVLNNNDITDNGLKRLVDVLAKDNTKLTQLKLESNPRITHIGVDYIFRSLKNNKNLEEFYVRNCSVLGQDLQMLQEKAITFGIYVFI
ncbi:unnamed protein product [Rotaria sordida]|uniref:Uncharacterized protein n=2 Tax=Rotaria sordida TaxID=392033 RepID=A0A815GYK8_9BILA|nr:unnamed protein product [Rotaria sordida]CAF1361041.1 unnamed protein product [Rotaria sordida]